MSSKIIDEEIRSMRNTIYSEYGYPSKLKVVTVHVNNISTAIYS